MAQRLNLLTGTGAAQSASSITALASLNNSFEWIIRVEGTTLSTQPSDALTFFSIGSGGPNSSEKARIEMNPYGAGGNTVLRTWIYELSDSQYSIDLEFDPTAITAAEYYRIVVRHTDGDPSSTTVTIYNEAGGVVATATAGGFFAQSLSTTTGSGIIYIGPQSNGAVIRVDAFAVLSVVGTGAPADPVGDPNLLVYYGFPDAAPAESSIGGDPDLSFTGSQGTDYSFTTGVWPATGTTVDETDSPSSEASEAVTADVVASETEAASGTGTAAPSEDALVGESETSQGSGSSSLTEDVQAGEVEVVQGSGTVTHSEDVLLGEAVSDGGGGSTSITEDVNAAPVDETVSEASSGDVDAGIELVFQTPDESGAGSESVADDADAGELDAVASEASVSITEDVVEADPPTIIDETVSEVAEASVSPASLQWADEFLAAVAEASVAADTAVPVEETVTEGGVCSLRTKDQLPVSGEAWAFVLDGHVFYVLNDVGGKTLVYDATTGQWHHWYTGVGPHQWNMFLGTMWNGNVIAADAEDGVLWELDPESVLDEGTEPINRAVTAFAPIRGKASARQGSLRLTGSVGSGDATTATVHMRFSDDEGRTWSTPRPVTLNVSGPGRIEWRSLGRLRSPGRIWEIVDVGGLVRVEGVDSDMEGS